MDSGTDRFLPFDVKDFDNPSLLPNKKQINESSESRMRCLELLRNYLKNLEGIEPCLDENFLLRFLRVSKFDVSKALLKQKKYHQLSDAILDAFKKCSSSLHKLRNLNHLWVSPYRLRDNSTLIIALNREVDYRKFTFAERFYLEVIALNELLENPINQICGMTLIMDLEGFGFRGLRACSLGWLKLFVDLLLNAFPCRIKAVHVVNAPLLFNAVFKIAYPFLSKKIQDRILFHSNKDEWRSLLQSIPADVLPAQYNGKIKNEALINGLENREELDQKFRNLLVFGYSKTTQRRHSILKKMITSSE